MAMVKFVAAITSRQCISRISVVKSTIYDKSDNAGLMENTQIINLPFMN